VGQAPRGHEDAAREFAGRPRRRGGAVRTRLREAGEPRGGASEGCGLLTGGKGTGQPNPTRARADPERAAAEGEAAAARGVGAATGGGAVWVQRGQFGPRICGGINLCLFIIFCSL
jgi:hypothetical protein